MNNPYLFDPDNNLAVNEIETNHPSHYNKNKIGRASCRERV